MSAAQVDPTIEEAKRRMLAAAKLYARAAAELLPATRALERHPDFAKTARKRKAGASEAQSLTLAYWVWECIVSCNEVGVDEVVRCLTEDATGGAESSMSYVIEDEERHLARIARREGAAGQRRAGRPAPREASA